MMKTYNQFISEKMCVDVKVGDTILRGRFKNKKTVVKKIGKDKHGPTINGKPALSFRLTKESSGIEYNVNDYVLVNKFSEELYAKIIKIDENSLHQAEKSNGTFFPAAYNIFYLDKIKRENNLYYNWVRKDEIIRKLKDEEIPETWKIIDAAKKYNL